MHLPTTFHDSLVTLPNDPLTLIERNYCRMMQFWDRQNEQLACNTAFDFKL
jgi:hypothetical protein